MKSKTPLPTSKSLPPAVSVRGWSPSIQQLQAAWYARLLRPERRLPAGAWRDAPAPRQATTAHTWPLMGLRSERARGAGAQVQPRALHDQASPYGGGR